MTIEHVAHVDRVITELFPTCEGWCSIEKGKRMARLVAQMGAAHPPLCVELGVFGGRGTIAMALAVKHVLRGAGRVDGIDPFTAAAALEGANDPSNDQWWRRIDYAQILAGCRMAIKRLELEGIVNLILRRSQDVVDSYEDASVAVLHQDSNHAEIVTCAEVCLWTPKMKPGGYWIFDDINWATTKKAQEALEHEHRFARIDDFGTWAVFQAPT